MASITTGIQLADNFTAPLMNIISSVNLAVSAFGTMDQAMSNDVDTSSLEAARNELNQASLAAQELNQTIQQTYGPIQDNENEQNKFNQSIHNGVAESSKLTDSVKGLIRAYATMQTAKRIIGASDELVQTTSRLDMMNDGLQSTQDLFNMVYIAANDARGSLTDMASVVARFGNNAKDAFSSSAEVVQFANLIQKQMTIAGASTQEAANAELQLSQALGSGVLRGDELNSIFEQAPNLIQNIADYLNVPIGKIREMAADGELSAGVVKAAVFAAADDINTNFASMPMTWGQMWTKFQNDAAMAFQPVLQRLNELANTDGFQTFATNAVNDLAVVAQITLDAFEKIGDMATFVSDNWSLISPVIYGVVAALAVYAAYLGIVKGIEIASAAASATSAVGKGLLAAATWVATSATWAEITAQEGLNAAMYACPIVWVLMLVIALVASIYLITAALNKAAGTSYSAMGAICGAFATAGAVIGNAVVVLINFVIDIFVTLWNFIAIFANFFGNVFNDPIGSIARLFFGLVDTILSLLETVASAIDTIFGSNLADSVSGWRDSLGGWVDDTFGKGDEVMAQVDASQYHVERFDYDNAFDSGYNFGKGIDDKISNFNLSDLFGSTNIPDSKDYPNALANSQMTSDVADTAKNTGKTADSLSATSEDLKYLRDIADREYVNRFTTAEIKVSMVNHNKVDSNMDLDGVTEHLRSRIEEEMNAVAEGEH